MFNYSYMQLHKSHSHYMSGARLLSLQRILSIYSDMEESTRIIKNLSDPTKLKIYLLLHKVREISVTDISKILKLNQPAISHALSDLKNLRVIDARRCGQCICYFLKKRKHSNGWRKFLNRIIKYD